MLINITVGQKPFTRRILQTTTDEFLHFLMCMTWRRGERLMVLDEKGNMVQQLRQKKHEQKWEDSFLWSPAAIKCALLFYLNVFCDFLAAVTSKRRTFLISPT